MAKKHETYEIYDKKYPSEFVRKCKDCEEYHVIGDDKLGESGNYKHKNKNFWNW